MKQPTCNYQNPKFGTVTVKLNKATVMVQLTEEQSFLEALRVARKSARRINAEFRYHQFRHDIETLPF